MSILVMTEANPRADGRSRDIGPRPIKLPLSLRRMLVQQFTVEDLRHLAWLKEHGAPDLQARRRLSEASLGELAEMLVESRTPTVGWWSRAELRQVAS